MYSVELVVKPMIFVVGNSRSGTTMMGRILGLHPDIFTFHELHFFEQLWSSNSIGVLRDEEALNILKRLINIQTNGYFTKVPDDDFIVEANSILTLIPGMERTGLNIYSAFLHSEVKKQGKSFPCKQTPQNIFYLDTILSAFKEARVIVMVRDPRDVMLSQKNKWKRRLLGAAGIPLKEALRARINYHPITISKLWNASINTGDKYKDNPRVKFVRYEDLITEGKKTINSICEFLNVPFNEQMLQVPHKGSSSSNDSSIVGIKSDNYGKWKDGGLSKAELYITQKTTANNANTYGYETSKVSYSISVLLYQLVWPIQIAMGLILNLHRMKNIKETIKKRLVS